MVETSCSYCQLESGDVRPIPGSQMLRGWVWSREGVPFVDLRARLGPHVFPGILGFPRSDLAAHFHTGRPYALAGFEVEITLRPGPADLMLEALDLDGTWRCVWTVTLKVAAGEPAARPTPIGPIRWIEYCHGLDLLLRRLDDGASPSGQQAARRLAAEMPHPRQLRHAPPPLVGFVDEPAAVVCNRFGRIPAFGHLFHPTERIRRVLGSVDLQAWQPIAHGLPSPGPAAFYTGIANASACGFAGFVDVPSQIPNPVSLRIYAELADQSVHLCQVVRARTHTQDDEKKPFCAWHPKAFDQVATAWDEALAGQGIGVVRDAEWEQQVLQLRGRFEAASRAHVRPVTPPSRRTTATGSPKRIVLATHGLGHQGAPGFLLDLARLYVAQGATVHVVSAEDGPLRARFSALGAEVTVVDTAAVHRAASLTAVADALADLRLKVPWRDADLVVANSFTTFWAVHAAKAEGCPVLLYVHESTTPEVFFGRRVPSEVIHLAGQALGAADGVSFTTAATRACHQNDGDPRRFHLTPPWIDVAGLDRQSDSDSGRQLRDRLRLVRDERLVCNLGTVSDRKGQHAFARAVDLLHRRRPDLARRTKFVMLGGRNTLFDSMLADLLAELGRPNLWVEPETSDYVQYYLAADVFVCSSYEESSPRVVLEAMACRSPIVASAVHGIPELVRPDRDALLLPAGNTGAWCDGLASMLENESIAKEYARSARERVVAEFDAAAVLPRHWALACAIATGKQVPDVR